MAPKRPHVYKAPFKRISTHDQQERNLKMKVNHTKTHPITAPEEIEIHVQKSMPSKRKNQSSFNTSDPRKKIKNNTNIESENTLNGTKAELNAFQNTNANIKQAKQKLSNENADIMNTVNTLLNEVVKLVCENEILESQTCKSTSKENFKDSRGVPEKNNTEYPTVDLNFHILIETDTEEGFKIESKFKKKPKSIIKEKFTESHTHIELKNTYINKLNVTKNKLENEVMLGKDKAPIENESSVTEIKSTCSDGFNEKIRLSTKSNKRNEKRETKKQNLVPVQNETFNFINPDNTICNEKEIITLLSVNPEKSIPVNEKQASKKENTLNIVFPSTLDKALKQDTKGRMDKFTDVDYQFDTRESEVDITKQVTLKNLTIPNMSALDYEKENQTKNAFNSKDKSYDNKTCNLSNLELGNLSTAHRKEIETPLNNELKEPFYESFLTVTDPENEILKKSIMHEERSIMHEAFSVMQGTTNCSNILPSKIHTLGEKENLNPDNIIAIQVEKTCAKNGIEVHESHQFSSDYAKNTEMAKNSSSIFSIDDFITENIIFREKDESEDDVIPTGIFQHLNEIFHYNKETTTIELKFETPNHSAETSLRTSTESKSTKANIKSCKLESITGIMKHTGEATMLVTASDCIRSINNQTPHSKQENYNIHNITHKEINYKDKVNNEASKENCDLFNSDEKKEIFSETAGMNKVISKESEESMSSIKDVSKSQDKMDEQTDFSDIEKCMEMDDDFDLTASQLSMLDADEKIQIENYTNGRNSVGQQTDISGNHFESEIINQLNYLRECIEYIKEKLDK